MSKNINAAGQYGNSQFTVSQTPGDAAFTTIQDAVDAANASGGGTIVIYPGTYTESIIWPGGISAAAISASGQLFFDTTIVGNQSFSVDGKVSFSDLEFTSSTGDTWTQDKASVPSSFAEFNNCRIAATGGRASVTSTPGGNFANLSFSNCEVSASLIAIDCEGQSVLTLNQTTVSTSTDNLNTIELDGSSSLNLNLSTVSTSGLGTGACINMVGATSSCVSERTTYNAGSSANACAFLFSINGPSVRSSFDNLFIIGGTYFARALGAFGSISYGGYLNNPSSTDLIDAQIPSQTLIESAPSEVWSVKATGAALLPNKRFISTSGTAQNFPLPTVAKVGEVFELAQNGAGLVTITQAAGQSIRFGSTVSTVGAGGSVVSSSQGDSIKIICITTDTGFQAVTGSIGNWTVA